MKGERERERRWVVLDLPEREREGERETVHPKGRLYLNGLQTRPGEGKRERERERRWERERVR